MNELGTLLIDGPNPVVATIEDWTAYLAELEALATDNDVVSEIEDARAQIERLTLRNAKAA